MSKTPDHAAPAIDAQVALAFLADASAILATSEDLEHSLTEVASMAVPSLADWCTVDIVEPDGSLRQVSSGHPDSEQERLLQELRRRYRSAKRGSEGVERVIKTGQHELVSELPPAQPMVELEPDERALYERVGPRSYMIVALRANDRVIGAATFMSTVPGRHYTEADLAVIGQLAARVAVGIENARLHQELTQAFGLLDTVFNTAPVGLAFYDTDLRCVRVNSAYAAMSGRHPEDLQGHTLGELLDTSGLSVDQGGEREVIHRRVLETGEAMLDVEVTGEAPHHPGERRHWQVSHTPVRGADDEILGLSIVALDVTERERLLAAERDALRRSSFLAEAGELLDSSLEHRETLRNVARIAVPAIADWCTVYLLDDDGIVRQVAVAHAVPEREELAWELQRRYPIAQDAPTGATQVIRSGRHELINDITDELLVSAAADEEHLGLLRELGLTAALSAPLKVRGRTLGALYLVSAESGRRFDQADVDLAIDLGRRAGTAVENSRLYTERSRIAHALQAELLPSELPDIPGLEVAARYRAAGEMNEVGGDFYDVFQRPAGDWIVFVGDVSGKGAEAAAVTALARYTLRAAARWASEPHEILHLLNDAMLEQRGRRQFATVCLACVTPSDGGARVRLSLGGHPPPMLLRADGTVEAHGTFGTLLGLVADPTLTVDEVTLAAGDALLLYTDGVTEAGEQGKRIGQRGLAAALALLHGKDAEQVVRSIEEVATDAQRGAPRDDMALIALRPVPTGQATAPKS